MAVKPRCILTALAWALTLWCHSEGLSGGFYADNGRQQNILYKPLERRDRHELQQEILHLLGLQHRPRPRHHDTHSSAPQYLLELYKALDDGDSPHFLNNGSRRAFNISDFIVSFVNRIHHKAPHLRHERDRRFWFDVSEVPPEEEIVGAELRLFRDLQHHNFSANDAFMITLYSLAEENNIEENLVIVDEILVTNHEDGWLVLNVTGPVVHWIAFPNKNLGLYLKIRTPGSTQQIDPHEFGLMGPMGPEEQQPFMVAFFKTSPHVHIRKPRAAQKRQQDSYNDQENWNPYSNVHDRYSSSSQRSCQRWTLYVSFKDLGWQDWIIAPDGYGAFYCYGECSFPLNAHMNATNHAIVQTLVHLMDPAVAPKPCCAPTQLSAITVLYFDDNSNVILKKYKNMVVKSCGCH